jgi:hypothetical protein
MSIEWMFVTEFGENKTPLGCKDVQREREREGEREGGRERVRERGERERGVDVTVCSRGARGNTFRESSVINHQLSCNVNLQYEHRNIDVIHSTATVTSV